MEIIPAIDLRDGRVVRLIQGDPARETRYASDPGVVAEEWERRGARWLHVVDLDGALHGVPANQAPLRKILRRIRIPAQVGGGLRTLEAVGAVLDLGASRAILGTAAIRDPHFLEEACRVFPHQVALGLDARDGLVAVSGWAEVSRVRPADFAHQAGALPLSAIIYTDIERDGMLRGPDLDGLRSLASVSRVPVIASGGIGCLEDIRTLKALEVVGVSAAIIGKALYDGRMTLEAALAAGREGC